MFLEAGSRFLSPAADVSFLPFWFTPFGPIHWCCFFFESTHGEREMRELMKQNRAQAKSKSSSPRLTLKMRWLRPPSYAGLCRKWNSAGASKVLLPLSFRTWQDKGLFFDLYLVGGFGFVKCPTKIKSSASRNVVNLNQVCHNPLVPSLLFLEWQLHQESNTLRTESKKVEREQQYRASINL